METVTRTSNGIEKVTRTSNGNFEQLFLSNRTIPVLPPEINPGIEQWIALIVLVPMTLLMPAMKEFLADAASGGAWVNRTQWLVSRTGVYRSTPGDIHHAVSSVEPPSPLLIGLVSTYQPCGLNSSQQVYGNLLTLPWSGTPKNWTLLLTESWPMIWIMRPFSSR